MSYFSSFRRWAGTLVLIIALSATFPISKWSTPAHAEGNSVSASVPRTLAAGSSQSYLLDASGKLYAWGHYDDFAFVAGIDAPKAMGFFTNKPIKELCTKDETTAVLLEDGTVWVHEPYQQAKAMFVQVPGVANVKEISASDTYIFAWKENGELVTWTDMPGGKFFTVNTRKASLDGIVTIEDGYGIKADGTVWFLGLSGMDEGVQVQGLTDAVELTFDNNQTTGYALRKDGSVWAWGTGKLKGDLQLFPRDRGYFEAAPVAGLNHVRKLASGANHFLALLEDGTVRAWGVNGLGQLGDGSKEDSIVPIQVSGLQNIVTIASGYGADHSFAVDAAGDIWSWGNNAAGQVGAASSTKVIASPVKVKFSLKKADGGTRFDISPSGLDGNLVGSSAGNGKGVIVATTDRYLMRSTDFGNTWSKAPLPAESKYTTLIFAKDRFYFSTFNTSMPQTFWSLDGKTWTSFELRNDDGAYSVSNVDYIQNQYVLSAVRMGDDEMPVYVSADGVSWEKRGTVPDHGELVWNGKRYVVMSGGYTYEGAASSRNQFTVKAKDKVKAEMLLYTSDDLKSWKQQSGSIKPNLRYEAMYNGDRLIPNYWASIMEVAADGTITAIDYYGNIFTSKDGITFSLVRNEPALYDIGLSPMFKVGAKYMIYGVLWRGEGALYTSTDKLHWTKQKIANQPFAMSVLKDGQNFVGFGREDGSIAVSKDGVNWSVKVKPYPASYFYDMVYANGLYVAVGSDMVYDVPAIWTSKDGGNWTKTLTSDRYSTGQPYLSSVTYGSGGFVAVGGSSAYTSATGTGWKKSTVASGGYLARVVWTGKTYLAVSQTYNKSGEASGSQFYTSANGTSWKAGAKTSAFILDVAVNKGTVVAVGTKNKTAVVLTSGDLNKWTETSFTLGKDNPSWKRMDSSTGEYYYNRPANVFTNVMAKADGFIIMSDHVYTSKDGIAWSTVKGTYDDYVKEDPQLYAGGRLVWTGKDYRYKQGSIIGVSPDLKNWDFYDTEVPYNARGLLWANSSLFSYGDSGLLVQIRDKK
ncbi:hypothetical protein [Gorillibacterium massiliense]|uniref:hypothetical protein n=1 Tax=Gorillibacterium massiliense TaxID=1280390 RepID=UPI0004BB154D|nr:hypothetical protein [Gorillibacterium massiliense]